VSLKTASMAADYGEGLASHLIDPSERWLELAYGIGRRAIAEDMGVLDVIAMHQDALTELLGRVGDLSEATDLARRAGGFLLEALGPFEMAQRGFKMANDALQDLNQGLEIAVGERTRELERVVAELRATDDSRRELLGRLVNAQEEERRLVANNIHDDSVQKLTAVGLRIHTLRRVLTHPEHVEQLNRLEEIVRQTIERLRHLLFELSPSSLTRTGLSAALREYLGLADGSTERWEVDDRLKAEPSEEIRSVAYRIAVEAITNVRKHAQARSISITLSNRDRGVVGQVQDDGVGFSPQDANDVPGHMGLAAMRQRAELAGGWIQIRSLPAAGTTVEFWLPDSASPAQS
jgi:signal transduction histidine kinase